MGLYKSSAQLTVRGSGSLSTLGAKMSKPCWETEADCKGPCFGDWELAPCMGGSEVAQDARVE